MMEAGPSGDCASRRFSDGFDGEGYAGGAYKSRARLHSLLGPSSSSRTFAAAR